MSVFELPRWREGGTHGQELMGKVFCRSLLGVQVMAEKLEVVVNISIHIIQNDAAYRPSTMYLIQLAERMADM